MPGPTIGVDRERFMSRVRAALASDRDAGATKSPAPSPAPEVDEALVRLVPADADLVPLFSGAATEVGMRVRLTSLAALGDTLGAVLADHECRRATISVTDDRYAELANAAVTSAGAEAVDWSAKPGLDAHYEADVGITDVDAALAETGSIVVSSGSARSRGAFLVPPVHVALVPVSAIVPDLVDLWSLWRTRHPDRPPTASVIITGPSKTADIEGILITGVHGPKAVEIVLITDA